MQHLTHLRATPHITSHVNPGCQSTTYISTDHQTGDEKDDGLHQCLADHHARMNLTFHLASRKTKEALQRLQRHNEAAKNKDLDIGAKVFARNRNIQGGNKIQDVCDSKHFKMAGRPDPTGNVYIVAPLDGEGKEKTLYQKELLHGTSLLLDGSKTHEAGYCHKDSPNSVVQADEDEETDD